MSEQKVPYICGPLTELDPEHRDWVKEFYVQLGDACLESIGVRGFVPHLVYDPIKNADAKDTEVYAAEHEIVTRKTSILIVYAIEPSWGAGIEVGWANEHKVPIVVLVPQKKVSRLLTGGPMVKGVLNVRDFDNAIQLLRLWLAKFDAEMKRLADRQRRMHELDLQHEPRSPYDADAYTPGTFGIPGRIPSR
ncbi:MAG: hypothetical protein ACOYUZ_05820 [Patescibacteria group bacterium]